MTAAVKSLTLFSSALQIENNLTLLFILLSVVIVLILLFIGYWLLSQILSVLSSRPPTSTRRERPVPKRKDASIKLAEKQDPTEWVKQQFPDALLMDAQTIIKEYKAGRRDFRNVYPAAVAPYGTYLQNTVLDGADFSRAMFYRAPFDETSLIEANFNGAYLEGASFRGAILRKSNLIWADLNGADLSGADLTGANLDYASLEGADMSKTILVGTIVTDDQLRGVRSLKGAIMPDGTRHQ